MALPALVYLFINNYLPLTGMVVAFKDFDYSKGIYGSDWAGFRNFLFLFKNMMPRSKSLNPQAPYILLLCYCI